VCVLATAAPVIEFSLHSNKISKSIVFLKGVTIVHKGIGVALGRLGVLATAALVVEFLPHSNKISKHFGNAHK
jgi:hypothetical protein